MSEYAAEGFVTYFHLVCDRIEQEDCLHSQYSLALPSSPLTISHRVPSHYPMVYTNRKLIKSGSPYNFHNVHRVYQILVIKQQSANSIQLSIVTNTISQDKSICKLCIVRIRYHLLLSSPKKEPMKTPLLLNPTLKFKVYHSHKCTLVCCFAVQIISSDEYNLFQIQILRCGRSRLFVLACKIILQ